MAAVATFTTPRAHAAVSGNARHGRARQAARATRRVHVACKAGVVNSPPKPGQDVVIVTGASSGLGMMTTKALVDSGAYVVMAVRSLGKAELACEEAGIDRESVHPMSCELNDLDSVRSFISEFRADKALLNGFTSLVCNAAVYYPNQVKPTFSKQGYEESVQVNHLSHFLMANELLPDLAKGAKEATGKKRLVIVGSVTGNTNTVAGQVPPRADLGNLEGFKAGFKGGDFRQGAMIDGDRFVGPKAYKDAKLCNMLTIKEMHRRFHDDTGVIFSTMYPGCIAETPLFRNHTPFFRFLFPLIQKYVTKGYVSAEEAGKRLAKVVLDDQFSDSGAYWAWKEGGDQLWANYHSGDRDTAYDNKLSKEGRDTDKAAEMFDLSADLVGIKVAKSESTNEGDVISNSPALA